MPQGHEASSQIAPALRAESCHAGATNNNTIDDTSSQRHSVPTPEELQFGWNSFAWPSLGTIPVEQRIERPLPAAFD